MTKYKNKVIVVTGAASGIGLCVAKQLAKAGATVVVTDIQEKKLAELAEDILTSGGKAEAHYLDVTDAAAFAELLGRTVAKHGSIDYLFNNAGIAVIGPAVKFELEDWNRIIDVNIRGVVHGVHAVLPIMKRQGSGHIVNTASLAGLVPSPQLTAYAMSKHAVVGLSVSLRAELEEEGVAVTAICPGLINTEIITSSKAVGMETPVERAQKMGIPPEKCAKEILKGVARNRSIVVVTGHAKAMAGIQRLAPRLVHGIAKFSSKHIRGR